MEGESFRDILDGLKQAFHEHEKEHAEMMSRFVWWLVGSLAILVSIGIWVGTISNQVKYTSDALQSKVSRDEFLGAVNNFNTKFENFDDKLTAQTEISKEIRALLQGR